MKNEKRSETAAEWLSIDSLVPWEDNPRNNAHAVPEVAKSIKRFGFASPIIARPVDDGKYQIIAGHTRHEAAKSLNLDRVPVRVMNLDPADAQLLALADNKVAEIASWSDGLGDVLRRLNDDQLDLTGLGFDDRGLEQYLNPIDEEVYSPNESEELDLEEFESFEHLCPRCGFEWNEQ